MRGENKLEETSESLSFSVMIKCINNVIPFPGNKALTIWPILFIRKDVRIFDEEDENHENIHKDQQVETLIVSIVFAVVMFFLGCGWWSLLILPLYFWIYLLEFLIRSLCYCSWRAGYKNISTEQEAYQNESNIEYRKERRRFAWLGYMFKKTWKDGHWDI